MEILTKIKNLFALAANSSNLEEAATASALAQKLLDKYQFSLADLASNNNEEIGEELIYQCNNCVLWKSTLLHHIAENNYTKSVFYRGKGFKVIGRPTDIKLVSYFWDSVVTQIENLTKLAIKNGLGYGKNFTNSFKLGATNTVISKLKKAKQESKEEASATVNGQNSLIWLSGKELELQKYLQAFKFKNIRSNSNINHNGYLAGKAAGENVNLGKGLNSAPSKTKLLT